MQEEIEKKSVSIAVQAVKLSFRLLYDAWRRYKTELDAAKSQKQYQSDEPPKGKQTVKQLIGQGQGVSAVDIAEVGLKDFQKTARKYGVDFAIVKDKNVNPPKYTVFFKAKDADAIDKVMNHYAAKQLKKEQKADRPSILKKLEKFKDIVAKRPRKEHEKRKEHER